MTDQISFPPLHDLPPGELEMREQHLLSEIARDPGKPRRSLPGVRLFQRSRSWRSIVAVAALVVVLTGAVGVGIAASFGAFDGIHAAQHPQTSGDVIDPATAAFIQSNLAGIQLDTARHIGQLPDKDSQNIYVITGSQNDLCTVVGPPNAESWCGAPLSKAHPATIYTYPAFNNDPAIRWITFGIAFDGVTSVSFQPTQAPGGGPAGPEVTVPITDNLWTYTSNSEQPPYALQSVTAHFADGTAVTEPATGPNCAAC